MPLNVVIMAFFKLMSLNKMPLIRTFIVVGEYGGLSFRWWSGWINDEAASSMMELLEVEVF